MYELEPSPQARAQGGMLDIHDDTGQIALRAADLYHEFRALVHEGGEATRVLDKHGTVLLDEKEDGDRGRPEVNRRALRELLIGSLPAGMIRWGIKVAGARTLADGRHEVTFADGSSLITDLLIGADGAWSKVRPLVSAAWPTYTGISFVETHLNDADDRHPGSAARVGGGGMLFALAQDQGFLAHRDSNGCLDIYCALRTAENWAAGITDQDVAKAFVLASFHDWDEQLRAHSSPTQTTR
ncbi:FAD-dependent oxidoreductase [Fodinicola feengrottensis]|uniref:FAD-dependent oxidoreductase n=1 Tax=Fodinicola feengrottensis TaxID=435914 RepID=UPI0028BD31EA|nr:hypothetical protein [Fodinicola feengrottensis]